MYDYNTRAHIKIKAIYYSILQLQTHAYINSSRWTLITFTLIKCSLIHLLSLHVAPTDHLYMLLRFKLFKWFTIFKCCSDFLSIIICFSDLISIYAFPIIMFTCCTIFTCFSNLLFLYASLVCNLDVLLWFSPIYYLWLLLYFIYDCRSYLLSLIAVPI